MTPALVALLLFVAAVDGGADAADGGAAPAPAHADGGTEKDGRETDGASATTAAPTAGTTAPAQPGASREPPPPLPPPPPPPPALPAARLEELTVVGTRESRTAGSAHVLKSRDLERLNLDNPEMVVKAVPGVYGRGEDGIGLRPNIGIRGTTPDRSKKITLMEDGILFGPAPYSAPAAYYFPLITRMDLVRVIKGPGAVSFGPHTVGGAIDLVTRPIPNDQHGAIDLAGGDYGYRKLHGYFGDGGGARSAYLLEGVHIGSDGFKHIDGGGDAGYSRNEWMWKGRYLLSTNPAALQEIGLKLGYSDEDSRETYMGLTNADLRADPYRRYRASVQDRMRWHRTQIVATYRAQIRRAFTVDVAVYRQGIDRTWRKVNRMGGASIADVLADPTSGQNQIFYNVLTGRADSSSLDERIFIGPNQRGFVSQGIQAQVGWRGATGPVAHRTELSARLHYDRIERLHTEDSFVMRDGQLVSDDGPTLTNVNGRAWTHALALHALDAASWGPLTVTPGVRVELISSWLRDRLKGSETASGLRAVVVPGIGAYGAITPALGALAGVYRGFSPPAPGLPAGRSESSVNYEAGLRWRSPLLRLEAIGFFNDYGNLTSTCTFSSGCTPGQMDNQYDAGRAHIYGAELFAQGEVPLPRGWALPVTAAYTHTRTELLETFISEDPSLGDVRAGYELPYVPRNQVVGTVGIDGPRAGLVVGGTYVSSTREIAGEGPPPEAWRTDKSFLMDLAARVRVAMNGEVYLNVRNALGATDIVGHRPFGARPVAPRWVQAGVKWRF